MPRWLPRSFRRMLQQCRSRAIELACAEEVEVWCRALEARATPVILHCPHGQFANGMTPLLAPIFAGVARRQLSAPRQVAPEPKDHVFTYSTARAPSLLERAARHYGLGADNVLPAGFGPWNWQAKVTPLREWLERTRAVPESFYVGDGFDVLPFRCPPPSATVLRQHDCRILFCPTVASWPDAPELAAFERASYGTLSCHLSAGAYVAERSFLVSCLREIEAGIANHEGWCHLPDGSFDDQLAWRHLHRKYYPSIRIDASCTVFARFDHFLARSLSAAST